MAPAPKKRRIAAAKAAAENLSADAAMADAAALPPPSPPVVVVVAPPIEHDHDDDNGGPIVAGLLKRHVETVDALRRDVSELAARRMVDDIDDIDIDDLVTSSSIALAELKSLQRRISLYVERRALASRIKREECESLGLALENLAYERDHLLGEISTTGGWRAIALEGMALSELGIDANDLGEEGEEGENDDAATGRITTIEGAVDAYLFGDDENDENENDYGKTTAAADVVVRVPRTARSHRDPSEHEHVLEKIRSDLRTRSILIEQLSKSRLELRNMTRRRDGLRGLLDGLPHKLSVLEKAGTELNSYFGGAGVGGGGGVWRDVLVEEDESDGGAGGVGGEEGRRRREVVSAANLLVCRPSCDRTNRFRLARSNLPSPLYVLYVQLAGYIDAWSSLEKLRGAAGGPDGPAASSGIGNDTSSAILGFVGAGGMHVSAVPPPEGIDGGEWRVALTLTPSDVVPPEVPSVLSGRANANPRSANAVVRILFSHDVERGVVRASLGEGEGYDGLLDNLFPGDDGLANPNVSLSLLNHDEDACDDDVHEGGEVRDDGRGAMDDRTGSATGKPYYWCQVLGGLDFPPPPPPPPTSTTLEAVPSFPIETCTRAVFRQLLRRIRARRTLAAILEYLGKRSNPHPLPVHPSMKGDAGAVEPQSLKAKLHSWGEDSKSAKPDSAVASAATKSYSAVIKRKSSTLKATVVIDVRNYPAEPPVWSLLNENGTSGTLPSWGEEHGSVSSLQQNSNNNDTKNAPPLFDAALHRIECRVNRELDGFVRQDVEATYDWILIHQLADIVSCWDEVMSATEGSVGSTGSKGGNDVPCHGRTRKGKDRRIVGFGERSPFFFYRNDFFKNQLL